MDVEPVVDQRRNRTERSTARYLLWPATAAFAVHALRNGALTRRLPVRRRNEARTGRP